MELPSRSRTRQKSRDDDLYAIEVIEEDAGRVKVHYVGYEESKDEWLDKDEIAKPCLSSLRRKDQRVI